jgi:hypothetical protein
VHPADKLQEVPNRKAMGHHASRRRTSLQYRPWPLISWIPIDWNVPAPRLRGHLRDLLASIFVSSDATSMVSTQREQLHKDLDLAEIVDPASSKYLLLDPPGRWADDPLGG